jgi:aldose 1-epimerase
MLTLTHGRSSLVLMPEAGGAIAGWTLGTTPLLRRAVPDAVVAGDVHAMACFPLLPYCNRIGHGRFRWNGHDHQIALNFGDHPHAIHGVGWHRAWTVESASATHAALSLRHTADADWPFAFDAALTYDLTARGLSVTIAMTNRHATAAPAGIGLHPYFPREHAPSLRFTAGGFLRNQNALPVETVPVTGDFDFAHGRSVDSIALDNCFDAWDGMARIDAGPASLTIQAEPVFPHLQVFTPAGAGFFCVEPVSHTPDSINRPASMQALAPGATLRGRIDLLIG